MASPPEVGTIKWLFERDVFADGNPEKMARAVAAEGMACAKVGFAPVGDDDRELKPLDPVPYADDDWVIVYGSMNLLRWLLRQGKWPQLAWYDFNRLRCQSYYAHWGQFLLQRRYAFMPLAEVRRRRDWLFETFAQNGTIFVRPDDNDKSFSGGPVQDAQFDQWYQLANFYEPGPDCLAVVSSPEVIHAEWRFVIGQRQVVTGSQYRRDGVDAIAPQVPPEAAAFAASVANAGRFDPHPVYAMDVCQTDDGYRLVEIGSICACSLYACDVDKVVTVASRIAAEMRPASA